MRPDIFDRTLLVELSNDEKITIQGGLVSYIPTASLGGLVKEAFTFVAGELADFGRGLWDGLSPLFK